MTTQRRNTGGTPFSNWLRRQKELDSKFGFVTTDIDYLWYNYKTKEYMIIEEKRYNSEMSKCQKELYMILHNNCLDDINYKGFYKIVFEQTSPENGSIKINDLIVTQTQLIEFLQFRKSFDMLFKENNNKENNIESIFN